MPTLDDDPIASPSPATAPLNLPEPGDEPVPEFGTEVHDLLTAAACSSRVRVQSLGRKAEAALAELKAAVKRDAQIAAAEAELSRLRRGGE